MRSFKNEKWMYRLGSMVASLALIVTTLNVNTACVCIARQPKLPD